MSLPRIDPRPCDPLSAPIGGRISGSRGTSADRIADHERITQLRSLADTVLSGAASGSRSGSLADQERSTPPDQRTPFSGGADHSLDRCPHVTEDWLREWYRDHPEVTCARCWLEAKGGRIRESSGGENQPRADRPPLPTAGSRRTHGNGGRRP